MASEFWTTLRALKDKGDPRAGLFRHLLKRLNFDKLSARALLLRKQSDVALSSRLRCSVDRKHFAFGQHNTVFKIRFSDGVKWVARVAYPECDEDEKGIEQEVAIMKFVRAKTTIPVPQVYDHDVRLRPDNEIGFRYILMDRMEGNPIGSREIPIEHRATFACQFASIFYQLSQIRFKNIGSICHTDVSGRCVIKDQVIRQRSTRETSLDYLFRRRFDANQHASSPATPGWKASPKALAAACQFLLQAVPLAIEPQYMNGPFPITHNDMHEWNILIDDEYNITGIIDWTSTMAMPIEIFACHPMFVTGLKASDEKNARTIMLRQEVAKEFGCLAEKAQDHMGMAIAQLIGTPKAELAHWLLTSPGRMVMVDAKIRVIRLVYGEDANWDDVERLIINGPCFEQSYVAEKDEQDVVAASSCDARNASVLGKQKSEK